MITHRMAIGWMTIRGHRADGLRGLVDESSEAIGAHGTVVNADSSNESIAQRGSKKACRAADPGSSPAGTFAPRASAPRLDSLGGPSIRCSSDGWSSPRYLS